MTAPALMDTYTRHQQWMPLMQMVAWTLLKRSRFVAQLSHSVSFSITNPSIWLCRASKGSGGEEKVQCWFSSSTFFGFEQRSRPCCHLLCTARSSHHPACLGPLCHDSKSVLASKFAQQQLHPIQCKEMSEEFNQWNQGGRFYLHQRSCSPICQQL